MATISYPSLLLMESHGLAPNVRSASFASVKVWSKLYQAGPYFVDLTLQPGDRTLELRGEILTSDDTPIPSQARARLIDERGACLTTELGDGAFVFSPSELGRYRLEVANDDIRITVEELKLD